MHGNAPLTPRGPAPAVSADRGRLDGRCGGGVDEHLPPVRPQVVAPLPRRGRRRARDRSSRPRSCPHQTPARVERRIVALRQSRKLGPARLAGIVGVPASTVHRVLVRHGVNRLRWMDRPTGRVIRRIETDPPRRAGPHRRQEAGPHPRRRRPQDPRPSRHPQRIDAQRGSGYTYIHTAIDAYTRLAYSEFAGVENTVNCVAFLDRAVAWFAAHGITIERILTDNGNGYRSTPLGPAVRRARHQPPPHPALPARHQRQGRTLQPHPARRMGLRPPLDLRSQPRPRP